MDHRVADLDAGRPAVDEDPAGPVLEHRQQLAGRCDILGRVRVEVQGRRELPFDPRETLREVAGVGVADHDPAGPEDLLRHRLPRVVDRAGCDLEQLRCRGTWPTGRALREDLDSGGVTQSGGALLVGGGDAVGEHPLSVGRCDRGRCRRDERISGCADRHEDEGGIRAELPRTLC